MSKMDPVIRAARQVAWDEGYSYSEKRLECDIEWDSGDTCNGCPTCQPVNPYRSTIETNDEQESPSALAALDVLSAFVSSSDTLRRLSHMARLAQMNGHDETAETMLLIADLGIKSKTLTARALTEYIS